MLTLVFLLQVLTNTLFFQSFGIYLPILQEDFRWSATALSLAVAMRQTLAAVLGPFQGWLLDKWGPKRLMTVGLSLLALGFILLSQVQNLGSFYLIQLLMAFGAALAGFLSTTTLMVNWFEQRRTRALSLMQIGMSLGGLLAPLLAGLFTFYGWRPVAFVSGLLILLGMPIVRLLKNRPEDIGLQPDGFKPRKNISQKPQERMVALTAPQALRTRAFWFLSSGHSLALLSVSAVIVHLVNHLVKGVGFSLEQAASLFAVMTFTTIIGQLLGGYLGDRYNKRLLASSAMVGHTAALLVLAFGSGLVSTLSFGILHGLAWGIRGPLMSALRADYFGRQSFGKIMGFSQLIVMAGGVLGPLIAGYSFDTYGSYRPGFLLIACGTGLGIFFSF